MRAFREDLADRDKFLVTVELVLAAQSQGGAIDTAKRIAEGALEDGRVSAVSITDNPGGNPALSPDVLGREILDMGMNVIVHMTCRDLNRDALESRALQLEHMGVRNVLALTGDYTATGFGGQGAPVFDLDSTTLVRLLDYLKQREHEDDPDEGFLIGCGVSPFKATEAECFVQYAKLRLKVAAGAQFAITQLGYDARKYQEVLQMQRFLGIERPALASLYFLMGGAAKAMNAGRVPGAVVTDALLERIQKEGDTKEEKRAAAIERTAKLGAIIKGLGYRGVHIGGIHKSFDTVAEILDKMAEYEANWEELTNEFEYPQANGYYMFKRRPDVALSSDEPADQHASCGPFEALQLQAMEMAHHLFFRHDAVMSPVYEKVAKSLDQTKTGRFLAKAMERPVKQVLFGCEGCGDCALPHTGFICPQSQCPKHQRNLACGGSTDGMCEARPDRQCIWVRCYNRLAHAKQTGHIGEELVPPRQWSCQDVASWLNFHVGRDHTSMPEEERAKFVLHENAAEELKRE